MFVVEDSTIGAKLFVIDCTDDRRTLPECSQVQPLGSGYAAHWSLPESCSSCCGIRFNFAVPKPLVMIQYNGSGGCAAFNSNCILRIFCSASAISIPIFLRCVESLHFQKQLCFVHSRKNPVLLPNLFCLD